MTLFTAVFGYFAVFHFSARLVITSLRKNCTSGAGQNLEALVHVIMELLHFTNSARGCAFQSRS